MNQVLFVAIAEQVQADTRKMIRSITRSYARVARFVLTGRVGGHARPVHNVGLPARAAARVEPIEVISDEFGGFTFTERPVPSIGDYATDSRSITNRPAEARLNLQFGVVREMQDNKDAHLGGLLLLAGTCIAILFMALGGPR